MILDILLELFYCFLYASGLTYIIYKVNINLDLRRCIYFAIAYSIVNYLLTDISIYMNLQYILKNILVFLYDFIYACFLIKKVRATNLIATSLYYVSYGCFLIILISVCNYVFQLSYDDILTAGIVKSIITFLVVFLSCVLLTVFYSMIQLVRKNLCVKEIVPFLFLNIFNMFIVILFLFNISKPNSFLILISVFYLIIFQTFFVNYLFVKTIKILNEDKENDLLDISNELNIKLMEDIRLEQEKINEFKHDMKNQLFILEKLSNSIDVKKYIKEMEQDLISNENLYKTGNLFVDACINSKVSSYKEINLDVASRLSNNIKIRDKDLCSLIFNLLDNAVEAAKDTDEKKVNIKLIQEGDSLLIHCSNSCDRMPNFKTKKGEGHGYGLRIIKNIVNKYNGEMITDFNDNTFTVNIYFYLKSNI